MTTKCKSLSTEQLEILVSFMEMHPSLATLQSKADDITLKRRKALWLELFQKLNSVEGGPRKTAERWKKAWADQKTKTQIKAIRSTQSTGVDLTQLEERILKIIASSNKLNTINQQNDETEKPDSDVLVTMLPLVAQNEISSVKNKALSDSVLSDSVCIATMETLSNASLTETILSDSVSQPEFGKILNEMPSLTLPASDNPIIIKQEPPDCEVEYVVNELITATEPIPPITEMNSSVNVAATSTFENNVKKATKTEKRKLLSFKNKFVTAEKAAESFINISERNALVLERIATAMETQASEAAKQTQLMQDLIDVLRNSK